jgi:predicted TIM-barrel fold metal-dependent hydrolase
MTEHLDYYGPVVDFHAYVGRDAYGDHAQTAEQLITSMDDYDIDAAVVAPLLDVPGPDLEAHDRLLEAASSYPGRLIPFARLDPRYGELAFRELETRLDDDGFKGLLFNPVTTCSLCYHRGVLPLMKVAAEAEVPVLIITGNHYMGLPEQVGFLASALPDLEIVIGHMGTAAHAVRAVAVAERHEHVYLESSLQQSPYRLPLAISRAGVERVLFGSAAPYSHPRSERTKVEIADLTSEQKSSLLGRNAVRLLELDLKGGML